MLEQFFWIIELLSSKRNVKSPPTVLDGVGRFNIGKEKLNKTALLIQGEGVELVW